MTEPPAGTAPVPDFAYGPHIARESQLRLVGPVAARRVLVLGCRHVEPVVAIARAGANTIVLDHDERRIDEAREACERYEVRAEMHRGDLADLAFLRGDSIDLVLSVYALAEIDDLNRLFRQVHRVLSPNSPVVMSLPHPAYAVVGDDPGDPPAVRRSYFDAAPLAGRRDRTPDHPHLLSGVFTSLSRAKFGIDALLEPEPDRGPPGDTPPSTWRPAMAWLPPTLVIRARKLGV